MIKETPKKTKKRDHQLNNMLKKILVLTILGLFLIGGVSAGFVAALVKDDPVRSEEEIREEVFKNNLTGVAYFANQNEIGEYEQIGTLRADEDRRFITWEEIPEDVYHAFLAVEDKNFEEHNGFNLKAFTRAFLQQILNSDVQTGGSTITQQLAKNTFYSIDKTYERKAKEIFLAIRIDRIMSKEDIFTAYVNKIPFGKAANLNNVYGIQAASHGYFNKDAKDLNLAESAYLAGLPQRPSAYAAFDSKGFDEEGYKLAKDRQELVLRRMLEEDFITKSEYEEALAYDIKAAFATEQVKEKANNKYPYLTLEVENRATEMLLEAKGITPDYPDYNKAFEDAKQELLTGGYKVYTTVDKTTYEALNSVAQNPENFPQPIDYKFEGEMKENQEQQVGATLVDNKTGAILGFVGGRDFDISQINNSNFRGSSTKRQPGSSIKPILDYAPALEEGKIQPATPIDDIPLGGDWEPENWNHKYNGRLTAREALKWSYNIPAVKVYQMVTPKKAYEYYTKLGFNVDRDWFMQAGLTPAIGTIGTSPEEMTRAYTTFANGGTYMEAYMIERIEDKNGDIVYEHQSEPSVVFSEQTAYLMTDMMRTVVNGGTGSTVRKYVNDRDIAGKTGTTNDSKDLWFVGYTPEVTLGVWVGYEYPYPIRDGASASKLWGKMLAEVIEQKPELSPKGSKFKQPEGLVKMEVSSTSGKLPTELTREAGYLVTDIFNKKYIPTESDDSLEKARVITYNGQRYLAKQETPDDMVQTGIFFKREPYELPFKEDKNGNVTSVKRDRPVDYEKELPTKVDPRVTNGEQPVPPQNAVAKLQGSKNIISWDKNTNENIVGYRIYRASGLSFGFKHIASIQQTNNDAERLYFEDTVNASTQYVYYIVTVNVDGIESSPSELVGSVNVVPDTNDDPTDPNGTDPDGTGGGTTDPTDGDDEQTSTLPKSPVNLTASSTNLNVLLSWDQNSPDDRVVRYNIYYNSKVKGKFQLIGSTETTNFVHANAPLGDGYYFITAINSDGESLPSVTIHVKNY